MSELRDDAQSLIEAGLFCNRAGLNHGSAGNISVRAPQGMLITPTGMAYDDLKIDDISEVSLSGDLLMGKRKPSSEWPFHAAIYRARPEINAVIHTHGPHSVALACLGQHLPSFHYMVAAAGGHDIPIAAYHRFGSAALSEAVVNTLGQRYRACLLMNHGLLVCETSLARARWLVAEVEHLCECYLRACAVGEPRLLDVDEMDGVLLQFENYGQNVVVESIAPSL